MTDKQIIINGIDVSKCNFRLERDNQQERADKLEQECERLEFDYQKQLKNTNKWIVECENLQKQLENYKQTLDEIEKNANKNFTHTSWKEYKEQLMQILDIINKAKDGE